MDNIQNLAFIVAEYEKIMRKKAEEKEKRKKYDMRVYKAKFVEKLTDEEWKAKKAQYNRAYYEKRKMKAIA